MECKTPTFKVQENILGFSLLPGSNTRINLHHYYKRTGMAVEKTVSAKPKKPTTTAAKTAAIQEKYTKTAILNEISENTELTRKQVSAVLDELTSIIERHLKKRGVGEFTLPGLLKIKSVKRPARPARKNVPNPFKPGEFMDIAKKPATTRVKILPLKKLKDFAE
jgi:nucleoid DNA-binding protein